MNITEFIALHEADLTYQDRTDRVRDEILEALGGESDDRWIWIRDITDDWCVYEDSGSGSPAPGLYRVGYTIDDTGDCDLVGPATPVQAETIYTPEAADNDDVPLVIQPAEAEAHELLGDTIALVERALREDGLTKIKVIEPGWGTSGFYSADVLKETGATAFPVGTHMYWDHPTESEKVERPERSLRDLAATTVTEAHWMDDGPAGPALYADAKVFAPYQPALEELAPSIGVSIRAQGKAHLGEADGRRGQIIDEIVSSESIDFVTVPGAGGEVLSLFEAVRGHKTPKPVIDPEEDPVDLKEALATNAQLTTDLTEARQLGDIAAAERDAQRVELARFHEGALLTEARDSVTFALADTKYARLADITKARLVESIATNPPVAADGKLDGAALTARFAEAVKSELDYIAALTNSGRVRGLGGDTDFAIDEAADQRVDADLDASFAELGLSEAGRKVAVAGRK